MPTLRERRQDEPVSKYQGQRNAVELSSGRSEQADPVESASIGDQRGENASTGPPTPNTATSTIMATAIPPPMGTPAPDNNTPGLESLLKAAVEAQQQRSAQTLEALLRAYQKNSNTVASAATTAVSHEQQSAPHAEDAQQ